MGKRKNKNKQPFGRISCKKYGDKIVVTIFDRDFNPFFQGFANMKDKKERERLKEELRFKGVEL